MVDNSPIDEAIKDLLTDDKENSYVITTDDPVFKQFGLSTFTSGQLHQFLQTNNTLSVPNAGIANGSGIDPFNSTKVLNHILNGGWDQPHHLDPNEAITPSNAHQPRGAEFMRFDILTKQPVNEQPANGVWSIKRYPGASPAYTELPDGTWVWESGPTKSIIAMNDELIAGRLAIDPTEPPTISRNKASKKRLLLDINASASGCVRWSQLVAFNFGGGCTPSGLVNFKLYVFDNSHHRNPDRRMATRGNPVIVGIPTNSAGVSFAGNMPNTEGAAPGSYPTVQDGGDTNPDNITAGELSTTYDPNTGKFEAGTTQILARLLSDVEAVALNAVSASTVHGLSPDDTGPNGSHAFGNFSVGEAMPMGVHNGNPYDFGPYLVGDKCNQHKKHTIRVVNRAPKPFPAGQIVMCSKINNEWIIQDFGYAESAPNFFETGNWRFCSMIANNDSYFQDERHFYAELESRTSNSITETKYEYGFRWEWFTTLIKQNQNQLVGMLPDSNGNGVSVKRNLFDSANSKMRHLSSYGVAKSVLGANGLLDTNQYGLTTIKADPSVYGSRRYQQVSSFDFVHHGAGGFREYSYLNRCNPTVDLKNEVPTELETQAGKDFFPMFGPIFPDGFDTQQVTDAESQPFNKMGCAANNISSNSFLINPMTVTPVANEPSSLIPVIAAGNIGPTNRMFPDGDAAASQLPADVGHNAKPYSTDGAPLDDQNLMLQYCNVTTNAGREISGGRLPGKPKDLIYGVRHMLSGHSKEIRGTNTASTWKNGVGGPTLDDTFAIKHSDRVQARWQWLGQALATGVAVEPLNCQSALGFKPNNPMKIAFMPLNLEHLTSWDYHLGNHWLNTVYGNMALANEPAGNRAILYKTANKYNTYGQFDFAYQLPLPRLNYGVSPTDFATQDVGSTGIDTSEHLWPIWSLHRNIKNRHAWDVGAPNDITGATRGNDYCSLAADYPGRHMGGAGVDKSQWEPDKNNAQRGFPYDCYTRDQYKYGNFPITANPVYDGREAVGIIAAKTTIRVGGFEVGVMTHNYSGLPKHPINADIKNWGVNNDSIVGMATTATFAKMYSYWPDEQTIFDPRYFAVMHFNPGQLLTIPNGAERGDPNQTAIPIKPATYHMWIDKTSTPVDYRVPCYYGGPRDTNPPEVPTGTRIVDESDTNTPIAQKIRPNVGDWKVATHRRGQLLPYSYYKSCIGLDYISSNYHIATGGKGYKRGDLFEVVGGTGTGAVIVVTEVQTAAGGPLPVGAILKFALGRDPAVVMGASGSAATFPVGFDKDRDRGAGFSPSEFSSQSDINKILNPSPTNIVSKAPGLELSPIPRLDGNMTSGFGAVIYVLAGVTYGLLQTDNAPAKQQATTRVSASSNNGEFGSLKGKSYTSRMTLRSPQKDGQYDVFIHHHNDVSHTTADKYDSVQAPGYQQFVTLELRGV